MLAKPKWVPPCPCQTLLSYGNGWTKREEDKDRDKDKDRIETQIEDLIPTGTGHPLLYPTANKKLLQHRLFNQIISFNPPHQIPTSSQFHSLAFALNTSHASNHLQQLSQTRPFVHSASLSTPYWERFLDRFLVLLHTHFTLHHMLCGVLQRMPDVAPMLGTCLPQRTIVH